MLAKTTYWEHQKQFCGESAAGDRTNDRSDDTEGESDFSRESDIESVCDHELDATVQEFEDYGEEDLELSIEEGNKMTQSAECTYKIKYTTPI